MQRENPSLHPSPFPSPHSLVVAPGIDRNRSSELGNLFLQHERPFLLPESRRTSYDSSCFELLCAVLVPILSSFSSFFPCVSSKSGKLRLLLQRAAVPVPLATGLNSVLDSNIGSL